MAGVAARWRQGLAPSCSAIFCVPLRFLGPGWLLLTVSSVGKGRQEGEAMQLPFRGRTPKLQCPFSSCPTGQKAADGHTSLGAVMSSQAEILLPCKEERMDIGGQLPLIVPC